MNVVPEVAIIGACSAVIAVAAGRGEFRDRQCLGLFFALALLAATDSARYGKPAPSPQERLLAADAAGNRYEAFYAAMLWGAEEPQGKVELARRDRAFGLFRTCAEVSSQILTELEFADEVRAIHADCVERASDP